MIGKDEPCSWLQVESARNKLFRTLIYLFTTVLIGLAGYGVHLNYTTSKDVARLQESTEHIKRFMYNRIDNNGSLAQIEDKEYRGK